MAAMGFGPADTNQYLPFVEQSFYERVIADTMLCFIAEAQAPNVAVYRGTDMVSSLTRTRRITLVSDLGRWRIQHNGNAIWMHLKRL